MERYAWKARVLPGKLEEYKKRHDEIWPEMLSMFRKAHIFNYTIWNVGNDLFGYYECDSIEQACKIQSMSEVNSKWSSYMSDVMEMQKDPITGAQPKLEQVFLFEGFKEI
jgi:L-rhamnose mutarotase